VVGLFAQQEEHTETKKQSAIKEKQEGSERTKTIITERVKNGFRRVSNRPLNLNQAEMESLDQKEGQAWYK